MAIVAVAKAEGFIEGTELRAVSLAIETEIAAAEVAGAIHRSMQKAGRDSSSGI